MDKSFWDAYPKDKEGMLKVVAKGIWFDGDNLPPAPEGFDWQLDNGGLRSSFGNRYRLWHPDLGYMKGSE